MRRTVGPFGLTLVLASYLGMAPEFESCAEAQSTGEPIYHPQAPAERPTDPPPWTVKPHQLPSVERQRAQRVGEAARAEAARVAAMQLYHAGLELHARLEIARRAAGVDVTAGVP